MAGEYRGALKVAGSTFKGWLVDAKRPARRVRFNLIIDGQLRGTFVANRRRLSFVRKKKETVEDTHGFSIPIRRAWVTGEQQTIRIEDPSSAALDLALTAKLGPAPNENFEDHVVSGQVSLGVRDRGPVGHSEERAEDAHEPNKEQSNPIRQLLKKIEALSDADLTNLVIAIERDILVDRVGRYERAEDWQAASVFRRLFLGGAFENLLLAFGRSALKAHNQATAARVLTGAAALFPQSFEASYRAGIAMSAHGELDRALTFFRAANLLDENDPRAKHEMVALFGKMLRNPVSPEQRSAMQAEHLGLLGALVTSENAGIRARYRVPFAAALYTAGRYDEAIATVDSVLAAAPNDVRALVMRARLYVARNEVAEAHAIYEHVLELDRDNAAARLGLKALSGLAAVPKPTEREADRWVCVGEAGELDLETLRDFGRRIQAASGYVQIAAPGNQKLDFWRSEVLTDLRDSGLIRSDENKSRLARWKDAYSAQRRSSPSELVAVVYDADDPEGERFAESAAAHHARQGAETAVVGAVTSIGLQEADGSGHLRIRKMPADLRRFLLENNVSIVHGISGAGPVVAEAIRFTNIAFICGLHFGEMLPSSGDPFPAAEGVYSRQQLLSIFERAGTVYTNSRIAQKFLEADFGVRCPVISGIPLE